MVLDSDDQTVARAHRENLMLRKRREILEYIDDSIRMWRARRDQATGATFSESRYQMAVNYVDAFQSIRSSIFGGTLPL